MSPLPALPSISIGIFGGQFSAAATPTRASWVAAGLADRAPDNDACCHWSTPQGIRVFQLRTLAVAQTRPACRAQLADHGGRFGCFLAGREITVIRSRATEMGTENGAVHLAMNLAWEIFEPSPCIELAEVDSTVTAGACSPA